MSFVDKAQHFTAAEFFDYVKTKKWANWKPDFIVLHNTSAPTLDQWLNSGHSPASRMVNLKDYYKNQLRWHSGPHLFIAPDGIWLLCDLEQDGVHASCYNKKSIGIEMVGEFNDEPFNSGPGLEVQKLTVACLAALHVALDITPIPYANGVTGLHFHKECIRDHHDCPGKNVDKGQLVAKVQAAIAELLTAEKHAGKVAALTEQTTFEGRPANPLLNPPQEQLALQVDTPQAADLTPMQQLATLTDQLHRSWKIEDKIRAKMAELVAAHPELAPNASPAPTPTDPPMTATPAPTPTDPPMTATPPTTAVNPGPVVIAGAEPAGEGIFEKLADFVHDVTHTG